MIKKSQGHMQILTWTQCQNPRTNAFISHIISIINVGEYGKLLPSTSYQISPLRYINRKHHFTNNELRKNVFLDLLELNNQGCTTWASSVLKWAWVLIKRQLEIDLFHNSLQTYTVSNRTLYQERICVLKLILWLTKSPAGKKLQYRPAIS